MAKDAARPWRMLAEPSSSAPPAHDWSRRPELAVFREALHGHAVTDLLLNADGVLWRDVGAGLQRVPGWRAPTPAQARSLAVRLVALGGRHLDDAAPVGDVRLAGGLRVHAVLPPVCPEGVLLSIRLPGERMLALDDLVASGSLAPAQHRLLVEAVRARTSLLVSGATGSGKTTLLGALLAEAGPEERLLLVEDVAELRIAHPHVVGLQRRQANAEGAGAVGLAELVREALRMRPDRILLGECRGAEFLEFCAALTSGHAGSAGTLHALSLAEVPARLEALGALCGLGHEAVARLALSAFGLLVHVERRGSWRGVAAIGRLRREGDRLAVEEISP